MAEIDLSSRESFARTAGPYARQIEAETGIPAEIMLGIAINEGALAKGTVASQYNNLFGIKAGGGWSGRVTPSFNAWEVIGGKNTTQPSVFRAYDSPVESFRDFATFLQTNSRYGPALQHTNDPARFVRELKQAGYATDPAWPDKVLRIASSVGGSLEGVGPAGSGFQTLAMEEGGGMEPVLDETAPLTPARIAELVRLHGPYSTSVVEGTREIDNPNQTREERVAGTNKKIPNPNPTYHIVFANGTVLKVQGERDEEGNSTGAWVPIGSGQTALTSAARTPPAGEIWQTSPDGTFQTRVKTDPATGRKVPVLDAEGNPVTQPIRGAGGVGGRPRTAEQTAADVALADSREASAALSRGRLGQLGQLAPETAALREAQTEKAQIDAAVAARKLIPEQMLLLQEADQTLRYAAARYQRGESTLEELQRTSTAVNAYVDAGMRGTTPAKQEELRQKQLTDRAKIGQDLLNQQVQSGTALAGNLSRDYQQLLAKTLEPPGEYDPLQRASLFTAGMGGGLQNPSTLDISGQLIGALGGGGSQMAPQAGMNWAQDYPGVPLASAAPAGAGATVMAGGEEIPEDAELSAEDRNRILEEVFAAEEEDLFPTDEDEEEEALRYAS